MGKLLSSMAGIAIVREVPLHVEGANFNLTFGSHFRLETIDEPIRLRSFTLPGNTTQEGTGGFSRFQKSFPKIELTMGYFFISLNLKTVYNRNGVYKTTIIIHYI